MDPYLEARWSDVHVKLIGFIGEAIQPLLPKALRARSEERILLEADDESRSYRSDITVVESSKGAKSSDVSVSSSIATVEPIVIRRHLAPMIDRSVQIIDVTNGNRVITAIEVLSPWNKASGRLNRDYLARLEDYARGNVSIVEIDLLRYPPRGRMEVTELDIPPQRREAYLVCVRRSWKPDEWTAFPMSIRVPLPNIPIPLRPEDGEIALELQPLIDRVYAAGGHDDIDYSKPPEPPLGDDNANWARELLDKAS